MKRKMLAVVLAAALSVTMFACGSSDTDTASSDASGEAENTEVSDSGEDEGSSEEIAFESQTVIDDDEISVVITGIETSDLWGTMSLNLELENKSDSVTYMVSARDVSVNGVMYDPLYADEVSPGNKAVGSVDFSTATLEEYGLDQITDIEINFYIYDSDTWEDYTDETVHVYPYGEENASVFERTAQDTDEILIDDDYMSLIVVGYDPEGLFGYTVNAYVVNKTDAEVMFSIEEASVNGYMCDPIWADEVKAGMSAFESIYFYDSSLEEIGITDPENEIETIEFVFTAYDNETFDTYTQQTVTLNP